jgi:hypothetical protein
MLNNFVAVYVPSTNGVAGKTRLTSKQQAQEVRKVATRLSSQFGGATATRGTGFYVTNAGDLIEESVVIVKSYYDSPIDSALEFARGLALEVKQALQQEAVTIETEAGIEFI